MMLKRMLRTSFCEKHNSEASYCASHKNWTSVHQLPLQNHCFIGSGGG